MLEEKQMKDGSFFQFDKNIMKRNRLKELGFTEDQIKKTAEGFGWSVEHTLNFFDDDYTINRLKNTNLKNKSNIKKEK